MLRRRKRQKNTLIVIELIVLSMRTSSIIHAHAVISF